MKILDIGKLEHPLTLKSLLGRKSLFNYGGSVLCTLS